MSNQAKKSIQWSRAELALRALVFVFVIAIAAAAAWYSIADQSGGPVFASGSDVRVPLNKLKTGKLFLVTYALDSVTTTQIALQRGEDGELRAAFSACRSCRKYHHYILFGKLICGHCGHSIRLPPPSEVPNPRLGCTPVALPYAVESDAVVINGIAISNQFQRWYRPPAGQKLNSETQTTGVKSEVENKKPDSPSKR